MNHATQDFIRPGYETQPIPDFPHAPGDWSRENAEESARAEGLMLLTLSRESICTLSHIRQAIISARATSGSTVTGCYAVTQSVTVTRRESGSPHEPGE